MIYKVINPSTLAIELSYESEDSMQQEYGGPWGQYPHIAVPEGLDPDTVKAVATPGLITVVVTPEQVIPAVLDEEGNEFTLEQVIPAVTEEQEGFIYSLEADPDKVAAKVIAVKAAQVTALHAALNTEVYSEMARIYDTSNPDSATAYHETWKLMAQYPEDYVEITQLEDAQAVKAFAEAKLAEVRAYSIWRLQKINAFKAARDALLAE